MSFLLCCLPAYFMQMGESIYVYIFSWNHLWENDKSIKFIRICNSPNPKSNIHRSMSVCLFPELFVRASDSLNTTTPNPFPQTPAHQHRPAIIYHNNNGVRRLKETDQQSQPGEYTHDRLPLNSTNSISLVARVYSRLSGSRARACMMSKQCLHRNSRLARIPRIDFGSASLTPVRPQRTAGANGSIRFRAGWRSFSGFAAVLRVASSDAIIYRAILSVPPPIEPSHFHRSVGDLIMSPIAVLSFLRCPHQYMDSFSQRSVGSEREHIQSLQE